MRLNTPLLINEQPELIAWAGAGVSNHAIDSATAPSLAARNGRSHSRDISAIVCLSEWKYRVMALPPGKPCAQSLRPLFCLYELSGRWRYRRNIRAARIAHTPYKLVS